MLRPLSFRSSDCSSGIFLSHLDFGLDQETFVSLRRLFQTSFIQSPFVELTL